MGLDLLALGEPLYELNQQPDGRYLPGFGGDTLNVSIAAARLGASAGYITRLGGDIFGDALMELMIRERIDVSSVARDSEAPTGLYFVTHDPGGHVFTYRRKGSAASLMTAADLDTAMIGRAKVLHASGISQAISPSAADAVDAAITIATASGATISFDTNFRPRLWRAAEAWPVIRAAAARADILKTSREDCAALIGMTEPEAIAGHFIGVGARTVLVTLGADGVLVAQGSRREIIAGYRVDAVDATGAGDAFTGALLAELVRGGDVFAAARFANAAAAVSTLGYGAIAPSPRREAVDLFIRSRRQGSSPPLPRS